jgi:hypothetical protein
VAYSTGHIDDKFAWNAVCLHQQKGFNLEPFAPLGFGKVALWFESIGCVDSDF